MLKSIIFSSVVAFPVAFAVSIPVQAAVTVSCSIQPKPNQPNPLPIRATLRVQEESGNTTFIYQNLPTPVGGEQTPVTIEQERKLIFYNTRIPEARSRMLKDPKFFNELRGFSDNDSYKAFDDALICQNQTGTQPTPTKAIADLPNGSYRFWNGAPSSNVTDQQILAGALTFLFTKEGDRIVGIFARPNETAMCITGKVTGNKISGVVNPAGRLFSDPKTMQNKPYDPKGSMRLGRWEDKGNRGSFSPSSLDLTGFNRINLGTRSAPSICR